MPEPVFFATSGEWRQWLQQHHKSAHDCLVGFVKVTAGRATMTWSESVDEALCFGWIDGVRRRIDDESYSIRFTPRKAGSIWSAVNVKKVEALRSAGRLTAAGEAAYASRSAEKTAIYSYEKEAAEFSEHQRAALEANEKARAFWEAQPPGYRKLATHWVTGAKRPETREKRLAELIEDSANGLRLRQWRRDA